MPRLVRSSRHAASLLWHLGPRRFAIVVAVWVLRRHRRVVAPVLGKLYRGGDRDRIARDPVLVYQMSKVGSTSLVYSLQLAYLRAGLADVSLRHVHTLSNLDLHEQNARAAHAPAEQFALLGEYRQIRREIDADPAVHWNVVSLVRDPVARHVSDFFHHIDRHLPGWRRAWRDGNLTVDHVMARFLSTADHVDHWFDTEVKLVFGVDVFQTPFPHEAGYCLYTRPPRVSVAVIRLEDLDRVAGRAAEELLGLPRFRMHPFNAGTEGDYADLYAAFKRRPLPADFLDRAYAGRVARHFYSDQERERFARRWMQMRTSADG
jgi:hypothetical protein